ncbi:MAG: DUF3413 domain-containing protein [Legionellaceae bacterium]|nr:DUF3413 domain-containing protein [Legionellaceae bacterium]
MTQFKTLFNLDKMLLKSYLRFVGWFFFINALVFFVLGSSYLLTTLQSPTLFKNLMADYSSLQGKIITIIYTLANFLSYMTVLAFIPASIVCLLLLFFPNKRLLFFSSIVLSTTSILLLILDCQIYAMFKFHINMVLLNFIFGAESQALFNLSFYEYVTIISLVVGILVFETILAWGTWKYIIIPNRLKVGKELLVSWFGCALFSYFTMMLSLSIYHNNLFIQQAANLPFYNSFLALAIPKKNAGDLLMHYGEEHYMQALYSTDKMNYPLHPMQCDRVNSAKKPYNIIFIMVDSLRFDSLKFMPHVMQFAKKSWQFNQHMSGGNSTQAGLFSLFYSIPSTYWTATLKQHISPVFIDLLLKEGYDTRIIYSSEMRNPPLDKTIYQKLSHLPLNGSTKKDVGDWDRDTTDQAVTFLKQKNGKGPFFLNLLYNAPHAFCSAESFPMVYQSSKKNCSRIGMSNNTDPKPYYHNYLNTVHFIDLELATLLKTIKEEGYLENSIIILTSDHGQEFNDNRQNYWGHASNYSSFQIHVPLLIHWPNQPAKQITHTTTGYDLVPTLLVRLFNCRNTLSDYSVGQDLLSENGRSEFFLVGSYTTTCIVEPNRLTTLHSSGEMSITDAKLQPIPNAKPQKNRFNQALTLMRKYYL